MRNRFDKELELLNEELIEMGNIIESSIEAAVTALIEQNIELAKRVVEGDKEVNDIEKSIERRCLKLLLHQQPVASDLRMISSALKMITDMERIGDQASDISEITIWLAGQEYIKQLIHIPQMAEATIKMVKDSIDAYVKRDLELVKSVIEYDDVVDNLFNIIKDELIELIRESASYGEQAIDLIMIAKYFERIGDHAQNIAEWVYYSITGEHYEENYKFKK
ncbi:phosphate signaling complex protein PhoU [Tissierella praeacuta]|uniref:phosphate signaling complex protein PhoU n=1 Tax=Tissierella praeacuta TaxID=43131 RepID=UPI000EBA686E|nr:phosphate signaling complex protein PhoU [Tissierella praeacuta]MBU5256440.1 phosphate signaling complex protein PhoU [Tissierella praeacuta]TCU79505.1 phosphate transport system protein [Tissierella praeacuta]HAE91949.1 phosphate transport system regulatory protein PhoU [Tissierella sp.]